MATNEFSGPVDYLVFGFQDDADLGAGLQAVLDRVQQGIVEILDNAVVSQDAASGAAKETVGQLQSATSLDLSVFDGVSSDILDADDLASIASALEPGQRAIAVVYEDRSFAVAAAAWNAVGGLELFSGGVDISELERALEEGNPS